MVKLITEPEVAIVADPGLRDKFFEWAINLCDELGLIEGPLYEMAHGTCLSDAATLVEAAGRHCYRAWERGRSTTDYIYNIIDVDHGSVLEHVNVTFVVRGVSRSLSMEHIRHRVGIAISQESQRYVPASDMAFVVPPLLLDLNANFGDHTHPVLHDFRETCERAAADYDFLSKTILAAAGRDLERVATLAKKRVNEASRCVLPNSAETRFTWTANIRALRHYIQLRGSMAADLEIRRLACAFLEELKADLDLSVFFDDLVIEDGDHGVNSVKRTNRFG